MKRVIPAIFIVIVTVGCLFFNNYARLVFLLACAIISVWEMKHIQKNKDQTAFVLPIYIGLVAIATLSVLPITINIYFIAIMILMGMIFVTMLFGMVKKNFDGQISVNSLIIIAYPVIPYMIMIISSQMESWLEIIPVAITTVWICDSFALIFGKLLGKRKLCPQVSPNKTWAGAVFGVIFGTASGVGQYFLLSWLSTISFMHGTFHYSLVQMIIVAMIISIVGQTGDLAASLVKRTYDVKDYSNIIPAHGGIMDKFDSILFAVPCALLCSVIFK